MMKSLLQYWRGTEARIDQLSLRERVIIFLALVLAMITVINKVLIDPALEKQQAASEHITQTQNTLATMNQQIQFLVRRNSGDPNTPIKAQLAALRLMAQRGDNTLNAIQSRLVTPQQMPVMLEELLGHNHGVRLISLTTLPVETLDGQVTGKSADPAPSSANSGSVPLNLLAHPSSANEKADRASDTRPHIYKHGVDLVLTGSYADLVYDMQALEAAPWRMFWSKAVLAVDDQHNLQLTLRLYTLSQDRAWLTI